MIECGLVEPPHNGPLLVDAFCVVPGRNLGLNLWNVRPSKNALSPSARLFEASSGHGSALGSPGGGTASTTRRATARRWRACCRGSSGRRLGIVVVCSCHHDRFRRKPPPQRTCFDGSFCEGFRMTAPSGAHPRAAGPSSESLQGRNPRDVGRDGAARSMGISTRPLRMRPLMSWRAERSRGVALWWRRGLGRSATWV
jgi:hypothetical protein